MLSNNLTPASVSVNSIVQKDNKSIVQKDNKKSFYKLMSPELKQLYELKWLDAAAYILLIVKTQRAAGWKWTFKVKDFCKEWGITTPTFYRAVSKLKTAGLLHWKTGETITVWHGADIAKDEPSLTDDIILSPENSLTDENQSITRENGSITDDNGLSPMIIQTPETIANIGFQDAPYLNQIFLDQIDNAAALKTMDSEENINQEGTSLGIPAPLKCKPESQAQPIAPHVDQGSAAPLVALKAVLPPIALPPKELSQVVQPTALEPERPTVVLMQYGSVKAQSSIDDPKRRRFNSLTSTEVLQFFRAKL